MSTARESQTTHAVLMIRPRQFGFNAEAAATNSHQHIPLDSPAAIQSRAAAEFAELVRLLSEHGVAVTIFDEREDSHTPDAIFPNNWISTHADGTLILYPMAVPNRRAERRADIVESLRHALAIRRVIDLSDWEARQKYLEGTGSLVLERAHRVAYAARSPRTDPEVLQAFAAALNYRTVLFDTVPQKGQPEYHTNVVMSIGEASAVICWEAIADATHRAEIERELSATGRTVIPISYAQMGAFSGNMLQLRDAKGRLLWVMSEQAYAALTPEQRQLLARDAALLSTPLPTIESVGGGSARCMLAELFFRA